MFTVLPQLYGLYTFVLVVACEPVPQQKESTSLTSSSQFLKHSLYLCCSVCFKSTGYQFYDNRFEKNYIHINFNIYLLK
jgi:hypothetical protein